MTPRGSRLLTFDLSSLEAQSLRAEKIDTPVETGVIKRPAFAVGVPVGSFNPEESLRSKRLADLKMHRNALAELTQELGDCSLSPDERATRFREVNSIRAEADWIESVLKSSFVPQHGELQLISPEHLLVNRLFNVRSKQTPRERMLSFDITKGENVVCTYEGPELRQSEGHVFMTLMNLTRDFKVGTEVSFEPGEMCRAMSGYYDGKSRQRLRDAIKRLMHAVITFPEFREPLKTAVFSSTLAQARCNFRLCSFLEQIRPVLTRFSPLCSPLLTHSPLAGAPWSLMACSYRTHPPRHRGIWPGASSCSTQPSWSSPP